VQKVAEIPEITPRSIETREYQKPSIIAKVLKSHG